MHLSWQDFPQIPFLKCIQWQCLQQDGFTVILEVSGFYRKLLLVTRTRLPATCFQKLRVPEKQKGSLLMIQATSGYPFMHNTNEPTQLTPQKVLSNSLCEILTVETLPTSWCIKREPSGFNLLVKLANDPTAQQSSIVTIPSQVQRPEFAVLPPLSSFRNKDRHCIHLRFHNSLSFWIRWWFCCNMS